MKYIGKRREKETGIQERTWVKKNMRDLDRNREINRHEDRDKDRLKREQRQKYDKQRQILERF